MTFKAGEQVQWCDLDGWSGKMSPELSAVTGEKTSQPSLKKRSKSSNRKPPLFLCLTRDGLQQDACLTWTEDGALLGEYTMHSFGEYPNAAAESRLSAILEECPHPKYSLSAKACQGILRRAERRGKDLPEPLKQVLIRQSQGASPQEWTEAPAPTEAPTSYAVRIRGGCDGGGKGALVQTEKSGTLGTGNDQTIFAATPINLMVATRCKALGRGTGFGVGEPGDPANTISAAHSHGVFATAIPINDKATRWQGGGESRNHDGSGNGLGIGKDGDPSPTLTAGDRHGVMCRNQVPLTYGIGNGQAHEAMTMAQEHGHQPCVYSFDSLASNSMKSSNPNSGCRAVDIAKTPDTSVPDPSKNQGGVCILDMAHPCDVIRDCGGTSPSLQARMGTGGNQVNVVLETYQQVTGPLMANSHPGSYCGQDAYSDMLVTQNVEVSGLDCRNARENGDLCGTLQSKPNGGFSYNCIHPVRVNQTVRRLTPLECERLQGYPDGWTDIGEWIDSKGKKHKAADSPRYKALGNSIALPFWFWLLRRISAQYERPATLGSLFDGIGGFPLCWERCNGKGTALWASEVEPFCIAVTERRLGHE